MYSEARCCRRQSVYSVYSSVSLTQLFFFLKASTFTWCHCLRHATFIFEVSVCKYSCTIFIDTLRGFFFPLSPALFTQHWMCGSCYALTFKCNSQGKTMPTYSLFCFNWNFMRDGASSQSLGEVQVCLPIVFFSSEESAELRDSHLFVCF